MSSSENRKIRALIASKPHFPFGGLTRAGVFSEQIFKVFHLKQLDYCH